MSLEHWKQATDRQPTLFDLLLEGTRRFTLDLPERGQWQNRVIDLD